MGLFNTLKRWNAESDARLAGEDAAKQWYRQGDGEVPSESSLKGMADEIAPGHEEDFMEGFIERWNDGMDAEEMNIWQRFWQSKSPL